jgi:hypothetical protein
MSRRSDYWFLYPLLGPILGLVFFSFVLSFGEKIRLPNPKNLLVLVHFEFFLFAYLFGGLQSLFVGVCDGVYAWRFKVVPIWLPLAAALFSFIGVFVVMSRPVGSSGVPMPFGTALLNTSSLLFTHLFAALSVWFLIKLIYRPVDND